MKKYFLIVLLVSLGNITLGDKITDIGDISQTGKTQIITQDLNMDTNEDLQNIKAMFCNSGNKLINDLRLQMRPGQRKKICIALFNQTNNPINILLGFSEGQIKKGAPVCDSNMSNKNAFSKYISHNLTTGVIVPASGNIVKEFDYTASKDGSGNILGCIAYKINKEQKARPGEMFVIVPRKVGYIYVNITGSVYTLGRWDDIKDRKKGILEIITAILAIWLVVTIVQTVKKSKKHHTKK